jgi:hypothetical protein
MFGESHLYFDPKTKVHVLDNFSNYLVKLKELILAGFN